MRKITTLLVFTILISTRIVSAQRLSFEEALVKLNSSNKKLKGKEKQVEAQKLGVKSTKGLKYPQISLNGSYLYMSDDLYIDGNKYKPMVQGAFQKYTKILGAIGQKPIATKIGGAGQKALSQDWKYVFQKQQITRFSVDLKYPIFTGGKIKTAIKAKEIRAEIAKTETKITKEMLIADLAEYYFLAQLATEGIKVREQVLASAKEHLSNAEKMEKNGMIAPVQVMLAKTSVADSERALLETTKDRELAKVALEGLLGGEEEFSELSTPLFKIKTLKSLEHYQTLAQEQNPNIVKAIFQKQLTEQNITIQKAHHMPDLAIIGKKYLYSDNLPITEPDNWYVGIGFKMDIFSGLKHRYKHKEAVAMKEGVTLMIEQAKVDIKTLVKKYYTQILKEQEVLESLEQNVTFADELVRVRTKAFKSSFATSTDVADANLYLESIKIKRLKAIYEIDKNLAKLLEVCGASDTFSDYILQ